MEDLATTGSGPAALRILEPFDSWYSREHPRMIATLLLATGDLDLATEGVDEACARALARWERVSTMDAPSGWAYSVALNHARRVARRRSLERRLLRRAVPKPNVPAPAGEVWDLVAGLPERQRQVVVLRYVADLKEVEIAKALDISRSTVSTTLRDARQRLGSLLDEGLDPPASHHKSVLQKGGNDG